MDSRGKTFKLFVLCGFVLLLVGLPLVPSASSPVPLSVPLPTSSDACRVFFALVNEHRIQETLGMMDTQMVPNEAAAQAWAVSFNTIAAVSVADLRRWESSGWSAVQHKYKIILQVTLKPGTAHYGWEEGVNVRWLTLQQNGTLWKIHEIATGP